MRKRLNKYIAIGSLFINRIYLTLNRGTRLCVYHEHWCRHGYGTQYRKNGSERRRRECHFKMIKMGWIWIGYTELFGHADSEQNTSVKPAVFMLCRRLHRVSAAALFCGRWTVDMDKIKFHNGCSKQYVIFCTVRDQQCFFTSIFYWCLSLKYQWT